MPKDEKLPKNPQKAQNPFGPLGKRKSKIAGLNDDTRVIYGDEHNKGEDE